MIDSHAHIGEDFYSEMKNLPFTKITDKELIGLMDKYKIDKSIIFTTPTTEKIVCNDIFCDNISKPPFLIAKNDNSYTLQCPICKKKWDIQEDVYKSKNKKIIDSSKKYENRLIPFATIDPRYPLCAKELQKITDKIRGVKIHPLVLSYNPKNLINTEIMDVIRENNLPLLFHCSLDEYSHPSNVIELSKHYSSVNFIIAHCAMLDENSLKEVKNSRNVYIDTSLIKRFTKGYGSNKTLFEKVKTNKNIQYLEKPEDVYRFLASEAGKDKLIFATDIGGVSKEEYGEEIVSFRNIDEYTDTIGHENIEKILKL